MKQLQEGGAEERRGSEADAGGQQSGGRLGAVNRAYERGHSGTDTRARVNERVSALQWVHTTRFEAAAERAVRPSVCLLRKKPNREEASERKKGCNGPNAPAAPQQQHQQGKQVNNLNTRHRLVEQYGVWPWRSFRHAW